MMDAVRHRGYRMFPDVEISDRILRFASGPVGRQAERDGMTCGLTRRVRLRFASGCVGLHAEA